jgi:hypothetical protein
VEEALELFLVLGDVVRVLGPAVLVTVLHRLRVHDGGQKVGDFGALAVAHVLLVAGFGAVVVQQSAKGREGGLLPDAVLDGGEERVRRRVFLVIPAIAKCGVRGEQMRHNTSSKQVCSLVVPPAVECGTWARTVSSPPGRSAGSPGSARIGSSRAPTASGRLRKGIRTWRGDGVCICTGSCPRRAAN